MEYEKLVKGLKSIRIALIIIISLSIFDTIQHWLFLSWLKSGYYFDNYRTIIPIFDKLIILKQIVMAIGIIFIGIGLFFIRKEPSRIGDHHKKNMKWAFILFWIYSALFVFQFLFNRFIWGGFDSLFLKFGVAYVLSQILSWSIFILFMLIAILPIWIIAQKGQRKLIQTYAIGTIVMSLIPPLIFIFLIFFKFEWLATMVSSPPYYYIAPILTIFFTLCLLLPYHEIIKLLQGKEVKSLGRWIKFRIPLGKTFERGLKKPHYLISLFVVFGLIFGSIWGGFIYTERKRWEDSMRGDPFIDTPSNPEISVITYSSSGHLDEGSIEDIDFTLEETSVINVEMTLTWQDESTRIGLQNHPDTFSLALSIEGDEVGKETGSNGDISFRLTIDDNEPFELASFIVTIELESAGDITGAAGLIIRQADNGNDYDLQVVVEYYSYE